MIVAVAAAVVDKIVDEEHCDAVAVVAVAFENTYSAPWSQERPEADQQRHRMEAHDL